MAAAVTPEAERAAGFRPDIEGLRAVAVLLILLYHAGVPGLSGGFVGVDVFFVISGFLITGLLARELEGTGRLDLLEFYARRARRILPAAFFVLGATVFGCLVFLSPVALWRATPEIAAAAAYIPNFRFAFERTDYFHPARVSPVIHYWSLGVEEQFYVVWPAFLWLAHRVTRSARARLTVVVGVVVLGSLGLSVVATDAYPAAAFYLLPTRAWELGAGALVALLGHRAKGLRRSIAGFAGALGLAMIAASGLAFGASSPFPATAALVPVLGSVLVISAGIAAPRSLAATALAWSPLRYLGRISYSLYLWHWPVLLFAAAALGPLPAPLSAAAGVACSFALAAVTYRWVEDPLRRGVAIGRRPRWNLIAALATSMLLIAATLGVSRASIARFRQPAAQVTATQGDPFVGLIPASGPTLDGPLPTDLIPPLLNLHRGNVTTSPNADGCALLSGETVNGSCTYGSQASSKEVVLFGDSHLGQWWPALERIMTTNDWRVVYLLKTSCTYADVPTMSRSGPKTECDTWREATLARISADRPALVILSANHRAPPVANGIALSGAEAWAAMGAGAARTIARLQSSGARVAVLADTPQIPFDPADCLSANADHTIRCAIPRDQALDLGWLAAEQAAAESSGATFVDVDAWVCPSDPCPMVIGRFAVFADTNHVTRPFAQGLTGRLEAALLP
jgi:peptidoglycan/LPS O-acetylase OafA/YrhL